MNLFQLSFLFSPGLFNYVADVKSLYWISNYTAGIFLALSENFSPLFPFSQEPCLLSHIRIYNKSVLEWEIAVGLRYKVRSSN